MQELIRTNDLVRLSWCQAILADAGIESDVFDAHMSAMEGQIGAFPRRLVVLDDDFSRAAAVIAAAERELTR